MERNWHRHFGGYGICINKETSTLMVIKKVQGPYSGRYDLPGGGVKQNESIEEAIKREFLEETGYEITEIVNKGTYDFLIEYEYNGTTHTHHVANFFEIRDNLKQMTPNKEVAEELDYGHRQEKNDSAGVEWVRIEDINKSNSSPLVMKALEIISDKEISSELTIWNG